MTKIILFFAFFSVFVFSVANVSFAFASDIIYNEPEAIVSRGVYDVDRFSVKSDSATFLSQNFKVSEFKSNDGADAILIDSELVAILQNIRDFFGTSVTISSAYRTAEQNAKVGGSSSSLHLYGRAADIKVTGVSPLEVAKYAETIGVKGIGLYGNFVHIDTRETKYYWNATSGTNIFVSTFGGSFNSNPYTKSASVVTGVKTVTQDNSVTILWNKSTDAQSFDVYLISSPYTWSDVKYQKKVFSNTCTFENVEKGTYCVFIISRPNDDTMQSLWKTVIVG